MEVEEGIAAKEDIDEGSPEEHAQTTGHQTSNVHDACTRGEESAESEAEEDGGGAQKSGHNQSMITAMIVISMINHEGIIASQHH